jgi:hypothetical protein
MGLAREIRRSFTSLADAQSVLVTDPVVEAAFPFETADKTLDQYSGALLHPRVVSALDQQGEPRIGRDWFPYRHQAEAWQVLGQATPQSVLVASGTGSGKTECFLVPMLSDLAREAEQTGSRLSGVRAIALYPLNALIASQQERLLKWTKPFGGGIRFGLYNGEMKLDDKAAIERAVPQQVMCRRTLWSDPPPILVTNVTMLEYLTVRRQDRQLLQKSQGKLRWIILDEAHSYTGSRAAEIALLLRRVLLAFGVSPSNVRFVATSATIGEGEQVRKDLAHFLRDVSGAKPEHVHVIEGVRRFPTLPVPTDKGAIDPSRLRDLPDHEAFDFLARNSLVQNQIAALKSGAKSWSGWSKGFGKTGMTAEALALEMARARRGDEALLPLRVHAFARSVAGLWSCINSSCPGKPEDWAFGAVHPEAVERCHHCGSVVLQVLVCRSCGEPALEAVEAKNHIVQKERITDLDEFAQDTDSETASSVEEEAGAAVGTPTFDWLFAARPLSDAHPLHVELKSGRVLDRQTQGAAALSAHNRGRPEHCPACGEDANKSNPELLRPFRFGAPFILSNATPVLLEGVPAIQAEVPPEHELPAEGRQLLSFTDSRQGTARFAAKLQNTGERNYIRSIIYHAVQESTQQSTEDNDEILATQKAVTDLADLVAKSPGNSTFATLLEEQKKKLQRLQGGAAIGISWDTLRARLCEREEISYWLPKVWGKRDPRFANQPEKLAEFLLLRELARRTRRANSVETMGLAKLRFTVIDRIPDARLPAPFRARGRTVDDWRAFLHLCLNIIARDYFAIRVERPDVRWLLARGFPRHMTAPAEARARQSDVGWPQLNPGQLHVRGAMPRLLELGLGLNVENAADREAINEVLQWAWNALLPLFQAPGAGGLYALDLSKANIAPVTSAWWCPVTRRYLDNVFCGFSPYGLRTGLTRGVGATAEKVDLPQLPVAFPRDEVSEAQIEEWLERDPRVTELRAKGRWTDLQDRIALFSPYTRTAEHSAQQSSMRLRRYESEFKQGEINVLNCSTTMEMGVDIGSVTTVMMTNVPPSIASYRQRIGRAGRRRQATALGFTFCKSTPLDREAFRAPVRFLERRVAAPSVTLSSRSLVQRHVNALLLAAFFTEAGGEALTAKAGNFFGYPADLRSTRLPSAPAELFSVWLKKPTTASQLTGAISTLIKGTVLEGSIETFAEADLALAVAEQAFKAEWDGLQAQAAGLERAAAKKAVGFQLARLCGEFLLSDLADRGFLPGHGFPTNVVQFVHKDELDADERSDTDGEEDNRFRSRQYPSRNLDIAVRDYAPGTDVVVDGLVYKSAGLTLNWKRPASDADAREIQSLAWIYSCKHCGAAGRTGELAQACPSCGSDDGLTQREFLRPSGFTVDHRVEAHAETDVVAYVPPEDPIVSAYGGEWHPFRVPDLGRIRTNPTGLVFHGSIGSAGHGYAVCLHCGRAAPEVGSIESPNPLTKHRPLRFTRADDNDECPGNAKPFVIKRQLALGSEIQTDVAEIQPVGLSDPAAAWALASTLRTGLAGILGIEPTELGIAVDRRTDALAAATHSIFLFDHASGGAGFSSSVVEHFPQMLSAAESLLDCKVDGCITGCSSCVLTADLRDQQDVVDRRSALAFVRDQLRQLAEPEALDKPDPSAVFSDRAVDEIQAAALDGDGVIIWMSAAPDLAALSDGPLGALMSSLPRAGKAVSYCFNPQVWSKLNGAMRLALRDLAIKYQLTLERGTSPSLANGSLAIATVVAPRGNETWASRDPGAGTAGAEWATATAAPIVRFKSGATPAREAVLLDSLVPRPEAVFRKIKNELDGPLATFGMRFAAFIKPSLERLDGWKVGQLGKITYSDRYLRSPLVARLFLSVAGGLVGALAAPGQHIPVRLLSSASDGRGGREYREPPFLFGHDWREDAVRIDSMKAAARPLNIDLSVELRDVAHAREMRLEFANGQSILLALDQGFGCWREARGVRPRFDFGKTATEQASALMNYQLLVHGPQEPSYVVVASGPGPSP